MQLQPGSVTVVSNNQGEFKMIDVAPGAHQIDVTFVGFSPLKTNSVSAAVKLPGREYYKSTYAAGLRWSLPQAR